MHYFGPFCLDERRLVLEAIESLPAKDGAALRMFYFEDRSQQEEGRDTTHSA